MPIVDAVEISLVIPCYNEEAQIGWCLDTVLAQQRSFDEVLIVDNNSTDGTLGVVADYADRLPLRVLTEPRQGVAWASQAGYDAATGQVIARIDADSRLEPTWAAVLETYLTAHPEVDAVGGAGWLYDSPKFNLRESTVKAAAKFGAESSGPAKYLNGNNMAMRVDAWQRARPRVKNAPGTHEDLDLTYALEETGSQLRQLPGMVAAISARRFADPPRTLWRYIRATLRTQSVHGRTGDRVLYWINMPFNVAGVAVWSYHARKAGLGGDRPSPVTG